MATAFYPCCGVDTKDPLILLQDYAAEVIFCDIDEGLSTRWRHILKHAQIYSPLATLVVGDVKEIVRALPVINLLFYRHDSTGEGGSGVFVLGDSLLPLILRRFPAEGGLIITDGSNSRGRNFERMIRPSGLIKYGWKFSMASEQPFTNMYRLHVIDVTKLQLPLG
jgi:hypothetical protein